MIQVTELIERMKYNEVKTLDELSQEEDFKKKTSRRMLHFN
jgi:hypothetical protein